MIVVRLGFVFVSAVGILHYLVGVPLATLFVASLFVALQVQHSSSTNWRVTEQSNDRHRRTRWCVLQWTIMANRKQRARIAAETMEILDRGSYTLDGRNISLSEGLSESCDNTLLYTPDDLDQLIASLRPADPVRTSIGVSNCTTFAAARRLLADGFSDPLCLNFASAKNPGGGFLSGSQAQEECLARASGLHASLVTQMPYYDVNRNCTTSLYTNHAIYSPCVPVFREDDDSFLDSPYQVSIVTSPAVNAGAVRKNESENIPKIEETMRHRIDSVLAIARQHGHQALVLGAWGCGVFANALADIARWFRDALTSRPIFFGAFHRVEFAVLDFADGTPTFDAFHQTLAKNVDTT
jgi:uncharacterized protein (TIGR02452 family)